MRWKEREKEREERERERGERDGGKKNGRRDNGGQKSAAETETGRNRFKSKAAAGLPHSNFAAS